MDADRTEANPLRDQLNVMRSRVDHLRDRLTHQSLLAREDAVADLQTSLEELQTANEELRAQSDELAVVRHELELERQRYQDLFDFAPDGYIVTDAAGTIREVNCAAARMLGVDSGHLVGKPLATYVNSSDVRAFRSAVNSARGAARGAARGDAGGETCGAAGETLTVRLRPRGATAPGDQGIDAAITYVPARDPAGVLAIRWMLRDVTRQKRAEQQVHQLNESLERRVAERTAELENANQTKDRFLAALSHEMRTPLTPALATVAQLTERRDLPPDLRDELAVVRRNIELETRLIDDLLDLTRVAHEKLSLDMDVVNVHDVVRAAADICYRGQDASAMPRLNLDLSARRHHVRGDAGRLSQVFWNLLRNAVKFTPADGSIVVRSFNPDGQALRVEVTDSGVGIHPHVLPRLFSPFEQGEPAVARRSGGLGLGLAISKALVEAQGGELSAHSGGAGCGSRFTVTLPLCRDVEVIGSGNGAAPAAPRDASVAPRRILLVEDHPDTARVLARLLSGEGHHVHVAGTVAEAMRIASNEELDLVISDVGLPDGVGTDLLRALRANRPNLCAIAMTGYGAPDDLAATRAAGFAAHLTKPVHVQQLRDAIAGLPLPVPGDVSA